MTTNTKNKKETFFMALLGAGLLSFASAIFGYIYTANQTRELEKQKFKNELIQDALNQGIGENAAKYIEILITAGLLENEDINSDSIEYLANYNKGRKDSRLMSSFLGAIKNYVALKGSVPSNLGDLQNTFPIKPTLKEIHDKIYYVTNLTNANIETKAKIRFAGFDDLLFNNDDVVYEYKNENLYKYDKETQSWKPI